MIINNKYIDELNSLELKNLLDLNVFDNIIHELSNNETYKNCDFLFRLYCIKGNFEEMTNIIKQNIITKDTYLYVLERLCYYNNIDSIKFLLNFIELNDEDVNNLFIKCSLDYNNESINYLYSLVNLETINKEEIIISLCSSGNLELLKTIKFENNNEYIFLAIKSNYVELVIFLLSIHNYPSINDIFYYACFNGNLDIIKLFKIDKLNYFEFINRLCSEWIDNRIIIKKNVLDYLEQLK